MRLMGFCLLSGAMVMILRQMQMQTAGLLSAAFSVLVVGIVLPEIAGYAEQIRVFLSSLNLDVQYLRVMLKAMGIVLVTQLAVQICEDLEADSIARRAEFCGRIALLGIAVPILLDLTQMAVDVLQ